MARGVNKVILIGTLGRDPEISYTPKGSAVARVSIATNEAWKDRITGEQHEHTEWHRVTFVDRQAETVAEYVKKGQQIYIEGQLSTRNWQDRAGRKHYTTEIIASNMQMLEGRGKGQGTTASFPVEAAPAESDAQDDDSGSIPF